MVPLPIRSLTKLATLQERHRELQHHLLGLMGRLQLRRQRGLLVNLEERELHSRLTLMQKELSQPNVCCTLPLQRRCPPVSFFLPSLLSFPCFESLPLSIPCKCPRPRKATQAAESHGELLRL